MADIGTMRAKVLELAKAGKISSSYNASNISMLTKGECEILLAGAEGNQGTGNINRAEIAALITKEAEDIKQDLAKQIRAKLEAEAGQFVNRTDAFLEDVHKEVKQVLANLNFPVPLQVHVTNGSGATTSQTLGLQHYKFPLLLKVAGECRINTYLVGPASSGKTTAAENVAKALGLPFYMMSVGEETSKSDLLGFIGANGVYVRTHLREAYENGGVFLMDEADAGNANVLTVSNALLANSVMGFPDAMVHKHKDFIFIAGGNTWGQGANRQYVGRNQLDAATLDRFAFMEWEIDKGLEAAIIGVSRPQAVLDMAEGGSVSADKWLEVTTGIRAKADELGIRHLVTVRATMYGAKLLSAGVGFRHVMDLLVWKGAPRETAEKLAEAVPWLAINDNDNGGVE